MQETQDRQTKQKQFLQNANHARFSKLHVKPENAASLIELFQEIVYAHFEQFGRDFSWRCTTDPYHIVVSEIMLQQTQTSRVEGKFEQFIQALPSFTALAQAQLKEVLALWQGLGYNRRAKALYAIAKKVVNDFSGKLPADQQILQIFPGIGQATAASVCAFAFNMPTVFIETNIRTVFLYFFFKNNIVPVKDREIMPFVAQTVDRKNPRLWYYALTDYGVGLKRLYPSLNKKSAHYTRQSKFEGSDRQIRGRILKALVAQGALDQKVLVRAVEREPKRVQSILEQLVREDFIEKVDDCFKVAS